MYFELGREVIQRGRDSPSEWTLDSPKNDDHVRNPGPPRTDRAQETVNVRTRRDFPDQSLFCLVDFWFCFLSFCHFLGPLPRHMEVPRLGVQSKL